MRTKSLFPTLRYTYLASLLLGVLMLVSGSILQPAAVSAADNGTHVDVATFKLPITPISAQYYDRLIKTAEDDGAQALVIEIDTPGGLVTSALDLSRTIRALKPGTKVILNVMHAGKPRDLVVTVAEFKDPTAEEGKAASAKGKKPEVKPGKLGLAVTELTGEQKKALKVTSGVIVEAADGAALAAGVGPGDVILRVNNTDITSAKVFNDTVAKLDMKKAVALLIRDEQGTRFITFRPED